jgi:homoserine dehydrogenase
MRLVLIGFGNVGQGFAQILRDKGADLQARYGVSLRLVGVSTASKGTLYHPDGLDPADLLEALARDGHLRGVAQAGALRAWDSAQLIAHAEADVLLETTPSNLNDGQPASDYCAQAIARGWHVVVANKGVVALHHDALTAQAREKGVQFRYEGTVMAGTPSLTLAQEALAGCTIRSARGILNGTTNYMLTQMSDNGKSYEEAFAEAQALGYLEADPTLDVGGWDAAGKALILARALFGANLSMADLDVSGITHITLADVQEAHANGQAIKLIVEVTPKGGTVRATRLPLSDPLASVKGGTNAITYDTDLLGNVTLIGAGAGRVQTGFALLTDLLAIHRLTAQG